MSITNDTSLDNLLQKCTFNNDADKGHNNKTAKILYKSDITFAPKSQFPQETGQICMGDLKRCL